VLDDDQTWPSDPAASPKGQFSHWQRMERILVATDGSLSAADAIGFAVDFAAPRHAELVFVHVVPTLDVVSSGALDDVPSAVPHEPTEHDRALLEAAATLAAEQGVHATTVLLGGSTADEIVAHADSSGADLIVIGSRGHGSVATALLGSVALRVLHTARQPVLVIRCALAPHGPGGAAEGPGTPA
jgi:nucleotide-binding universal stress UspA family protein